MLQAAGYTCIVNHVKCSFYCVVLLFTAMPCGDGEVQLVGGFNQYNGRVERCVNQEWGTICADGFTDEDAANACEQAGKNGEGQSLY